MNAKKPPKTREQNLAELAELLPKKCLRILKHGKKVLNQNTGQVETVDPSAADLNVMRALIKDMGAGADSGETENPFAARVAAMQKTGALRLARDLPPLDAESKDRATA